jgi:hypothetical protein
MPDKFDTPSVQFLERKLSTILSADVAEFSRLMGEDEEQTLRVFRGHKKVFESVVAMHNGRIFNTAGDAILAEFPSAVEAVRCATDIQAALRTRNDIYSGQICFAETPKDPARCFHGEGTATGSKLNGRWPMGRDTGVFMNLTGHIWPAGELEIEMHNKTADGTVLNNIFLTRTLQDGSMTAKGVFQMGRKVTLDWHKN